MNQQSITLKELENFDIAIFLDCEYTCWENSIQTMWSDPRFPMEVVQVGMAFFDFHENKYLKKISKYIRPKTNPILSNYCENLLNIEQEIIDKADDLQTVFKEISDFILNHTHQSLLTCSWGNDRECITNDAKRNSEKDPFGSLPSMDLQVVVAKILGIQDRFVEREEIKQKLGLSLSQCRHDALDDALDIKSILDVMIENEMVD